MSTMASPASKKSLKSTYLPPLGAGALAGFSVDVALYPLDTIKTRLQSAQGFQKAGGFSGIYRGLMTVVASSMPTTAVFFGSYEATKKLALPLLPTQYAPAVHMFAASMSEVFACMIRVPAEIAKQRKQANTPDSKKSSIAILFDAYKREGIRKGLYRGFLSTVLRDMPFSFIELPVWELLKTCVKNYHNGEITSLQSAICGSIAGGFAAAVTTPLDLAKTRIMLEPDYTATRKVRIKPVLSSIYIQSGVRGLFAGVTPRMTVLMVGGFVFFGVYEQIKNNLEDYLD